MKLSEIAELLEHTPFAIKKNGIRTPLPKPLTSVTPPTECRYVFEVSKHITMPESLAVGEYRSFARIPGHVSERAVSILEDMLNDVLFDEVRTKRRWAYAIRSSRTNYRHFYTFSIECDGVSVSALDDIEELIESCVVSMAHRQDLFDQKKRRSLAAISMFDSMGKWICDGALDDLEDEHRIVSLAEYGRDFERASMNDIRELLDWLRPEQRWTLIVKP